MLRIRNLKLRRVDGKTDPARIKTSSEARRSPRHHGAKRFGKSTSAQVLAGRDIYKVAADELTLTGTIFSDGAGARARSGLFLAFQYPVEIPGVNNSIFSDLQSIRFASIAAPELDAWTSSPVRETSMRSSGHGRHHAEAFGQRRLFGR